MANTINADNGVSSGSAGLKETADSSGILALQTNGTTAVTVDTSQNVGIGTASPTTKLDVRGTLKSVVVSGQNASFLSNTSQINIGDVSGVPYIQGANQAGSNSGLAFYNYSSEAMRIDSSGRLLIGTTSGTRKLTVYENASQVDISIVSSTTGVAVIQMGDTAADNQGQIIYRNSTDAMEFGVNGAERMRIDSSGNLLVGYTTSNGSYKLQVNSQIFATSAVIATSDGRYKKDIQSLDGALELVTQLNPVQFSWKQHPIHNFDTSFPTLGFIAQEVKQVLANKPYLNSIIKINQCVIEPEEKDIDGNITKEAVLEEFLGIAESNIIALLTKSIQEQQIFITKLTERIAALEAK